MNLQAQENSFEFEPSGAKVFDSSELVDVHERFKEPNYVDQLENSCQRREFRDSKEESYLQFKEQNKARRFLERESKISEFVNAVFAKLVSANPELDTLGYQFIVYRSEMVNARAQGSRIIYLNLGLLDQLESVDQLAFVMSHELSHDYLFHSWKTREALANTVVIRNSISP